MRYEPPWVLVLAAGDGKRLREMTTDGEGHPIPKQFCSLDGQRTLLEDALDRGARLTTPNRIVTVVAEAHCAWWEQDLHGEVRRNAIVQPRNRGTASGALLPLLSILARDPDARILLLPSDHYVARESVLRIAALEALDVVARDEAGIVLLGMAPDKPETEYGWILPRSRDSRLARVERFVEKPPRSVAARLMARGGLWNSFLLAARGVAILDLARARVPRTTRTLERALAWRGTLPTRRLARAYLELDNRDFSRHVLEGSEAALHVLEVPPCGWTDLGTPGRVSACLQDLSLDLAAPSAIPESRPILAAMSGRVPAGVAPLTHGAVR